MEATDCVIDAAIVAATPLIHSFKPNMVSKDDRGKSITHLQARMDTACSWVEPQEELVSLRTQTF